MDAERGCIDIEIAFAGLDRGARAQAVEAGLLDSESRAYDITHQVILQGFASLTPAQRQGYITEALPALNEMMRRQHVRECSDNDNTPY